MADLKTLQEIADNFYEPVDQTGTNSLKFMFEGNNMVLKFATIVHFAEEQSLKIQVERNNAQALQLIDARIADIKSRYRERVGSALRLEDLGGKDNLELISATSSRKVAYYRYNRSYVVSE